MAKLRISPILIVVLLVIIFFGVSLLFRVYSPHDQIFVGDNIKYASPDAYFYMRLVDNAATNFPHMTQFDPYYLYPGGNNVTSLPFFHWMIVFFSWVIGLGHPTQHIIDLVGVYLPAIMGALTVVPVFFIGKALWNKWAGVLAAGLVAILPGEFLSRSMLGATDNPVAETLFTTTALAFLIYAIKTASQNGLTFDNIVKRDWKVIIKPLILSLFAGIFLGLYLATWGGALIFVFIIALYLIIQFIINHVKRKSNDYLCIVGFVTFLFTLIVLLLNPFTTDVTVAMVIATALPLVLYGISRLLARPNLSTLLYPLTIIGIGIVAVLIVYFAAPGIYSTLLAKFKFVFFPSGATAATTTEVFPALLPDGSTYTTLTMWGNYTTSIFIAPWWLLFGVLAAIICGAITYLSNKERSGTPLLVFFIVVTGVMIALTVLQLPSSYNLDDTQVVFIPGVAIIGLSILMYLFVKRENNNPWYISFGWVIALLAGLSLLIIFSTYQDIRYLALAPLAIIIYILFKQRDGDEQLRFFIIWCVIMLILPMIQRRFQYYLVVNIALLSGYLSWEIIRLAGLNMLRRKSEDTGQKELAFAEAPQKHNYYELLGVNKNASYKEIKSAFRKLTANYHPGPGNTPETETRFKELNNAHNALTNPSHRASYDASQRAADEKKKWRSRKSGGGGSRAIHVVNVVLAIVVVFLFVYTPNLSKAQAQSEVVSFAMSNDWQIALHWLKDNTPDPMGDPAAYYYDYDAVKPGQPFQYPASVYAVTAWWDFGYWIIREAHRIPNDNPSQQPEAIRRVATFFLSSDQTTIDILRTGLGSRYIISDFDMSYGKFGAMVTWVEENREKYMPTYYMQQNNQLIPIQTFSPEYYRTLIVRLYNFGGKAVTEGKPWVITYKVITVQGMTIKQMTDAKDFETYQAGLDYIASQDPAGNYAIVGTDMYVSPVTLDAVEGWTQVYDSVVSTNSTEPVKIFEYSGD